MEQRSYTIVSLIQKRVAGEIREEERQALEEWIEERDENRAFFDRVTSGDGMAERARFFRQVDKQARLTEFDNLIRYRRRRTFARYRVAAAAAVVVAAMLVWQTLPVSREHLAEREVIKPGSTRATLTVSDGAVFSLQSGSHQVIDMDGVARVDSVGGGIVYVDAPGKEIPQRRDILRTSRGGEYRVYLSDGSMICLNTDTEVEYSVPFDADKREVRLSGEAYFEIAKESDRPFIVIAGGTRIRVRGTTFAVNTRREEQQVQTVLIEGSVGVRGARSGKEIMMTPGQLSLFSREGELLELKEVNTYPYIAWKDGKFVFEEEKLEYIMQTLSLWYDVEIAYRDSTIKDHLFTGHLKKYDDIDTILNAIAQIINVDFEINGRVITVKD